MAVKVKEIKPEDKPTASKVGQLRSYLARMGYGSKDANALVAMAKTMRQIGNDIAADMRGRK